MHGRDFKPAKEALLDVTTAALRAGIERDYPDVVESYDNVPKDIAYYGDLSNELLESFGKRYDEQLDLGDRSNALNALRSIQGRKRFGLRQYDCLPGKSSLREFAASITAPVLGVLGLTMPLLKMVAKDLAEYISADSDYTKNVRERVRDKICELFDRDGRILLITHGMGGVAAYDVLWQLSHDERFKDRCANAKIDTLLTLGTPLGDSHIRKRLLGAKEELSRRYPTNVISWHNVSAEDDYACHDNTIADDFKKMMDQRVVSAVHDHHIYNHAVRYGRSNPHSSVGYYIHPRVSKIVTDWIRSDRLDETPKYTF